MGKYNASRESTTTYSISSCIGFRRNNQRNLVLKLGHHPTTVAQFVVLQIAGGRLLQKGREFELLPVYQEQRSCVFELFRQQSPEMLASDRAE